MKKVCWTGAVAMLGWSVYWTARWVAGSASLGAAWSRSWAVGLSDPGVFLVSTDLFVFSILVLAWMAADMRRRGLPRLRFAGWFLAVLILGSPAALLYLALRPAHMGNP